MKHRQKAVHVDLAGVAREGCARDQDKRIKKREPKNDERGRDPESIEVQTRRRRSDGEIRHRLLLE